MLRALRAKTVFIGQSEAPVGGGGSSTLTPLQKALQTQQVGAVKALLADPATVLSSTPTGKEFRAQKSQESRTKYLAQERFRRTNYADGCMPPLVLAAKQSCIDPEKTAEILALLLAEPRVTVDPAIGALAAKFSYNCEAPLAVLKGDPRTGLDEWEVGKDPTALNLGVALAIGTF